MKAINEQLAQRESGVEIFYVDEADVDLNPRIGFLWSPVGQQITIPTPGKNQKRYLAGALHARTGRVDYIEGLRKNTNLFFHFDCADTRSRLAIRLCTRHRRHRF